MTEFERSARPDVKDRKDEGQYVAAERLHDRLIQFSTGNGICWFPKCTWSEAQRTLRPDRVVFPLHWEKRPPLHHRVSLIRVIDNGQTER
jgi:hypothetical protein